MKVLNLYAGIGGNRKLWPKECEVTPIENNPEIAKIYQDFFQGDKVIIADAHQYLLKHFEDFDFIWSSPPCPTHSRICNLNYIKEEQGQKPQYPDMRLWQEIIFLRHWFKGKWCVENVISYYGKLMNPFQRDSHYFWTNIHIGNSDNIKRFIREHVCDGIPNHGFVLQNNIKSSFKEQLLNNCVNPKLGLHIFNCAFKEKQETL